jgi:hypothetical protein
VAYNLSFWIRLAQSPRKKAGHGQIVVPNRLKGSIGYDRNWKFAIKIHMFAVGWVAARKLGADGKKI